MVEQIYEFRIQRSGVLGCNVRQAGRPNKGGSLIPFLHFYYLQSSDVRCCSIEAFLITTILPLITHCTPFTPLTSFTLRKICPFIDSHISIQNYSQNYHLLRISLENYPPHRHSPCFSIQRVKYSLFFNLCHILTLHLQIQRLEMQRKLILLRKSARLQIQVKVLYGSITLRHLRFINDIFTLFGKNFPFFIQIGGQKIGLYRNFYLALQKTMFHNLLCLPLTPTPFDIFHKYHSAIHTHHFPFRLYSIEQASPSHPMPPHTPNPQPTAITRGPYRRYSREEKQSIIIRMLDGATLKKIAEETSIPKRNLIRWKHEFLHSKSIFSKRKSNPTVDECRSQRDTECIETKEAISEEQNVLV